MPGEPEGDRKTFLTETFLPDWIDRNSDYYSISDEVDGFVKIYGFHPRMKVYECGTSESVLALAIYFGKHAISNDFNQPYNDSFINGLASTKRYLQTVMLRDKVYRLCPSSDIFCKVLPLFQLYDHIEYFINDNPTKEEYDLIRLSLMMQTVWDPDNSLQPLPFQPTPADEAEIFTSALEHIVNIVKAKDVLQGW